VAAEGIAAAGPLTIRILSTGELAVTSLTDSTSHTIGIYTTLSALQAEALFTTGLRPWTGLGFIALIDTVSISANTTWITVVPREAELRLWAEPTLQFAASTPWTVSVLSTGFFTAAIDAEAIPKTVLHILTLLWLQTEAILSTLLSA